MNHIQKPFQFSAMKDEADFIRKMESAGITLPCRKDLQVLAAPLRLGQKTLPNRLAVHPCEGFDGTADGKPTQTVVRRYRRYAQGGSGLIWFEAVAATPDGRCNPYQLMLNDDTAASIASLVEATREAARAADAAPRYLAIQMTHSGRSAVDANWKQIPLVAFRNPYQDPYYTNITVADDSRIERLRDEMVHAAELAAQAGFDAVDVKLCHNYIMRELLAGFTREGRYGGSYENRTRFIFEVIEGIRQRVGTKIDICVRLNAYDCIPYPYGWGMLQKEGVMQYDLAEPIRLIRELCGKDVRLINISTMMPRYSPNDTGFLDSYQKTADLNPYRNTATLLQAIRELKQAVPEAVIVATGLSWYENYGPNVAAGGVADGWFDLAGFGRQAMAYPDYAADLMGKGRLEPGKCCVTCDKCYELIGMHQITGCVVRDREVYLPLYQEGKRKGGSQR